MPAAMLSVTFTATAALLTATDIMHIAHCIVTSNTTAASLPPTYLPL
jgi:hypothetical protein